MENIKDIDILVSEWEDLINECSEDYNGSIYDLDYDLIIREDIETIIDSGNINDFYRNKIILLDRKFNEFIIFLDIKNDEKFWKRKFILKKGSYEYRSSVINIYGKSIEEYM